MSLTGKERQDRYWKKLKQGARGVTPEMVVQAARVMHRLSQEQSFEMPGWEEYRVSCVQAGGNEWQGGLPDDVGSEAYDWVESAEERELLRKVACVVHSIRYPPAI